MSFFQSLLSFFGLGDLQWLCMVTLFIASLVTLTIYFVQYYLDNVSNGSENSVGQSEEANALLQWALSLKSWKAEWKKAWVRALNDNSRQAGVSTAMEQACMFINIIKDSQQCAVVWTLDKLTIL